MSVRAQNPRTAPGGPRRTGAGGPARWALILASLLSASPDVLLGQETCTTGAECDDGRFCNGQEACVAGSCVPGGVPCPSAGCIEAFDLCAVGQAPRMEAGYVVVGSAGITVALGNLYRRPVVVATAEADGTGVPAVTRVSNVTGTSFRLRLQNPSGATVEPRRVGYLVMEEGAWMLDGLAVEAQRVVIASTDGGYWWHGEPVTFRNRYRTPIVVGQVMDEADPRWSVFWMHGTSSVYGAGGPGSSPTWEGVAVGRGVGEDPVTERLPEEVGFIVFEAGRSEVGGVALEAGETADAVSSLDQAIDGYFHPFTAPFQQAPEVVLANLAGMDNRNGGWAQILAGARFPTGVALWTDEDQLKDDERSHPAESVAYVAFERAFQQASEPGATLQAPEAGPPGQPGGLIEQSSYHACRADLDNLGCFSPEYAQCVESEISACEATFDACSPTDEILDCLRSAMGNDDVRLILSFLRLSAPVTFWAKVASTAHECGSAVLDFEECYRNASSIVRFGQQSCECETCPNPDPLCPNLYNLDIDVAGLRCDESVTAEVLCESSSTPSVWLITGAEPHLEIPGACHHTDDWVVNLGPVQSFRTGEVRRSCAAPQAFGEGVAQGAVQADLDCGCTGAACGVDDEVPLTFTAACLPENGRFTLDVKVENCGAVQSIQRSWSWDFQNGADTQVIDLGITGAPGAEVTSTIVDGSTAPGIPCAADPVFQRLPDQLGGGFDVATVTCSGDPAPGTCGAGGDTLVGVEVRGETVVERGGVELELQVAARPPTTSTAQRLGFVTLGIAPSGAAYSVQVVNSIVPIPGGISLCTYSDSAAGTVPLGARVTLGTVTCQRLVLGDHGFNRPFGSPGPVYPDPFDWTTCTWYCPPGRETIQSYDVVTVIERFCYLECFPRSVQPVTTPNASFSFISDTGPATPRLVDQALTVSGTADDDGGIQGFVFGIDGIYAGHLAAGGGPTASFQGFSLDTSALPDGTHRVSLIALDDLGLPTFAELDVQVNHAADPCASDTAAPTVAFTAPAAGVPSAPGPVPVAVDASDAGTGVKSVRFFVNGERLHVDPSAPFEWTGWAPGPGTYGLRAVAVDRCNQAAEATMSVAVADPCSGQPPPTIASVNYDDGDWVEPGFHQLQATVVDASGTGISRVELQVGSFPVVVDLDAPYTTPSYALTTEGPVVLEVRAVDGCDRSSVERRTIQVSESAALCQVDASAPQVAVVSPTNGAVLPEGTTTVTAAVSDDTQLEAGSLEIDGTVPTGLTVLSSNPADYHWSWTPAPGSHVLRVKALDVCGKVGASAPITVSTVVDACASDTTPPAVSLTSPGAAPVEPGSVPVTAGASDASGIATVTFLVDGVVRATDTTAPFSWDGWSPGPGSYLLTVRAEDGCGNVAVDQVTVTVSENASVCQLDGSLPWATITTPAPGATPVVGPVQVAADAGDDSSLQLAVLEVDGAPVPGTTILSGDPSAYTWSWDSTVGSHDLRVRVVDVCGKLGVSPVRTVTVQPLPTCSPSSTRLCFQNGRFQATLSPSGGAVSLGGDSGAFWLYSPGALDVLVKVVDAGSAFWVFHGALTDTAYTLTVTDLWTSTVRTYAGGGAGFCGGADTGSFPDALATAAPSVSEAARVVSGSLPANGCVADATRLCLQGNRFQVSARYRTSAAAPWTTAQAAPYRNESGAFWFFSASNLELGVKILDGTAVNGKYWVFHGAASSLSYEVDVLDTVTGVTKTYLGGGFCGGADTAAF